ncbi:MAG: GDP-mannose 4,6-dehydratase [Elusimicrobia bacterium]|nr:GDP-mannose 4,6-dehydratase [Elusimicrobiota bacterium]
MKCLITGVAGFVGSHLVEFLLKQEEVQVCGVDRWYTKKDNINHLLGQFEYREFDMTDFSSVFQVLEKTKPDKIFHLAAQSFVPTSWNAPAETLNTNIIGQLNIFEAVRQLNINPWIQLACSSEEYGLVYPDEVPIKETNQLRPLSPYAVSKVAQDLLGYQYGQSYKLKIVRTRAFNHTGPRRGENFVTSNFAKQIVEIEKGKREPVLLVGNLEAKRDFTDVRDVVRAYWLATEKGEPGEVYNICSNKTISIKKMLDLLLGLSPMKNKITIKEDSARLRPSDVQILFGDCTKFRQRTGWKPEISLEKTMADLLDYWRGKIS